jgi:transposase
MRTKCEVAAKYKELSRYNNKVTATEVANETGVSHVYARKVMKEVDQGDTLVDPDSKTRDCARGPGSMTLSHEDELTLLHLRDLNPQRSLASYQSELYQRYGTIVSAAVISKWFNHAFDIKGSFIKTDTVPHDKYRPENFDKLYDFIFTIKQIDPSRLKFADEKHLKGSELYSKYVRRCPLTGTVENVTVDSDFRNTYNIVGICGINVMTPPFFFRLSNDTNDSFSFSLAIQDAVAEGFLSRGEVLVLDNAPIHCSAEIQELEDWLYQEHGIFVLYLPTRSPELNPIELMWHLLVQRLKRISIRELEFHGHRVAHTAAGLMDDFTHEDVWKCYRHCNY